MAALGLVGMGEALYMLAFTGGWIDSLWCPFFGPGCDRVARSKEAAHLGIPNSAGGVVFYAATAALAVWAGRSPPRDKRVPALGLAAASGIAVLASAYLVWAQAARVRAFCFWCLTTAGLNTALAALTIPDAARALARPSRALAR
jgi:uncharacterized membrane protein